MSDLDFEELDKAVNKIVSKRPPTTSPQPTTMNNAQAAPIVPPDPEVVKQPRGQFMDIVHPAAIKPNREAVPQRLTEASAYPARKVVSRLQGDVITSSKVFPPSAPIPIVPAVATPQTAVPLVKNDWPDPIDAAASSSLFLPDAKVEKRPLGGVPTPTVIPDPPPITPPPLEPEPTLPASEMKDDHSQPPNMSAYTHEGQSDEPPHDLILPPELGADLVAIEENEPFESRPSPADFNNHISHNQPHATQPMDRSNVADSSGYIETEPAPQPAFKKPLIPHPEPKKAELSGLLSAGSIPQQYKTAPVSNEAAPVVHPMFFDADHTGDSAAHRPKAKTTTFQWIFIVVGLLLLGATLGTALFVFVHAN